MRYRESLERLLSHRSSSTAPSSAQTDNMGCAQSTPAAALGPPEVAKPAATKEEAPPSSATPAAEKPRPRVFALMRNGHEVIRGGVADIDDALAASDVDVPHVRLLWQKLSRWMDLHMKMEEGSGEPEKSPLGMFRYVYLSYRGWPNTTRIICRRSSNYLIVARAGWYRLGFVPSCVFSLSVSRCPAPHPLCVLRVRLTFCVVVTNPCIAIPYFVHTLDGHVCTRAI
jgi:hypothetical protein